MIGGYLSFAGIEGKARYHDTPVEAALPVTISATDDRAEGPRAAPRPEAPGHPVLAGVPDETGPTCSATTGYGAADAEVLVRCGDDALSSAGTTMSAQRRLHLRLRAALGPRRLWTGPVTGRCGRGLSAG